MKKGILVLLLLLLVPVFCMAEKVQLQTSCDDPHVVEIEISELHEYPNKPIEERDETIVKETDSYVVRDMKKIKHSKIFDLKHNQDMKITVTVIEEKGDSEDNGILLSVFVESGYAFQVYNYKKVTAFVGRVGPEGWIWHRP